MKSSMGRVEWPIVKTGGVTDASRNLEWGRFGANPPPQFIFSDRIARETFAPHARRSPTVVGNNNHWLLDCMVEDGLRGAGG
jgi:hypothetical protein